MLSGYLVVLHTSLYYARSTFAVLDARTSEREKEEEVVHSSEIGTSSSMNLINLTLISVVSSPLSTSDTKKTSTWSWT